MLSLEQARQQILAAIPPLAIETVPLARAAGRFVATPLNSPADLPAFDNSAMDGYAVRAQDTTGASHESPAALDLIGAVPAGQTLALRVANGACVRIFTGSSLPAGADAVVMQEDTRVDPANPGRILVLDGVKPWENLRFQGEDVKRGQSLAAPGDRLTAGRLALLAGLGFATVSVRRSPVVGLMATGSELIEPGQSLGPGQIHESNRLMLATLLQAAGATPRIYPIVKDTLAATRAALALAFAECEAVVTSGGVSVGEFDFVKQALRDEGGELNLWRVAIKPGKPFVFGRRGDKFLFGLPGNPVSALVTFLVLVRPALDKLAGGPDAGPPTVPGALAEPLTNSGDRRHFVRVVVDACGGVRSAGTQASHLLASLAAANGLVDVPPNTTLPAGATVPVLRWE